MSDITNLTYNELRDKHKQTCKEIKRSNPQKSELIKLLHKITVRMIHIENNLFGSL